LKTLGKNPDGELQKKIEKSDYFNSGSFKNIEYTEMLAPDSSYLKMAAKYFQKTESIRPSAPLPSIKTDLHTLSGDKPSIIWFGHSSYFIQSKGFKILVDPVFCGYASPFPFMVQAFKGSDIYTVEDLPDIDLLIITHDHYDHLDFETITKLKSRVAKIIVPLGVSAHLVEWGVDIAKIIELDWHEQTKITESVSVTACPTRHFSGRSLLRNKTLWCAYVLKLNDYKLFLGGDSGYGRLFNEIGKKYGPFDMAFLECGQYGDDWPSIHMKPEETALAGIDLQAKVMVPVHWGKFVLSMHAWNDPVIRVLGAAKELKLNLQVPKIGALFHHDGSLPDDSWWNFS
jgi:L-ascorbate metabolism protein UlaG (beta-lactamase superfamily)